VVHSHSASFLLREVSRYCLYVLATDPAAAEASCARRADPQGKATGSGRTAASLTALPPRRRNHGRAWPHPLQKWAGLLDNGLVSIPPSEWICLIQAVGLQQERNTSEICP